MEYVKCCKCGYGVAETDVYVKIPGLMCYDCAMEYEHKLYREAVPRTIWDDYVMELSKVFLNETHDTGPTIGAR